VNTKVKLFIDFDGTIARGDIGNAFFRRFGGEVCTKWIERYHAGEISAQECFYGERNAMGRVRREDANAFLTTCDVDAGFPGLVAFCRSAGIPITILSDGLDYYITALLRMCGCEDILFFSNRLLWPSGGEGVPVLQFPHGNAECDRCACCKRNIMLDACGDEDIMVYVGDGYSDRCPVEYADVVFAKGSLQAWCQQKNISYYPYTDLLEVRRRLEELAMRRTLRRKARAEQRRREAFTSEA
jgi:2-hydroxy-3-keto-5-methylthiopentenyl-1-phosphate phosphatase